MPANQRPSQRHLPNRTPENGLSKTLPILKSLPTNRFDVDQWIEYQLPGGVRFAVTYVPVCFN
ncbi:MAG: hypothetical protein KDA84_01145 [Planctomycetaceae bacterium]|nr:hypothetical protein [Planctomycetaceae bacterium]